MRGLMMDRPLSISSILDCAARYHGEFSLIPTAQQQQPFPHEIRW